MPDYKNAKIYRLVCNVTGKQYIGSTTQTLAQRLTQHVSKTTHNRKNNCMSREIIANGNYTIVLIQEFPCENKNQLHARERHYIETMECINRYIPTRTLAEWWQEHRDELLEQQKQYYQEHRDERLEYRKQRYNEHRDEILERNKQYRQEHRDEIAEHKKQYHQDHRDERLEYSKQYYQDNRDKLAEQQKQYYKDNRDKILERNKQYQQEHRIALNEYRREYQRQWRLKKKNANSQIQPHSSC